MSTRTPVPLLVVGAGLALAIAVIHLQDQGGLLGDQSPTWLKYGYYLVEIGSTVSAALIIRGKAFGWLLHWALKCRASDRIPPVVKRRPARRPR